MELQDGVLCSRCDENEAQHLVGLGASYDVHFFSTRVGLKDQGMRSVSLSGSTVTVAMEISAPLRRSLFLGVAPERVLVSYVSPALRQRVAYGPLIAKSNSVFSVIM